MKNEFDSSGSFSFSFFLLIKDERIKVPQSAGSWSIWCYLILTRHGTAHVGSARALHLPLPILWLCPMPSTSCCLVYISHRLGPRQIKTSRGWRRVGREEKSVLVFLCAGEFIISLSLSCVFLLLYITAGTANHASGQLFVSAKDGQDHDRRRLVNLFPPFILRVSLVLSLLRMRNLRGRRFAPNTTPVNAGENEWEGNLMEELLLQLGKKRRKPLSVRRRQKKTEKRIIKTFSFSLGTNVLLRIRVWPKKRGKNLWVLTPLLAAGPKSHDDGWSESRLDGFTSLSVSIKKMFKISDVCVHKRLGASGVNARPIADRPVNRGRTKPSSRRFHLKATPRVNNE